MWLAKERHREPQVRMAKVIRRTPEGKSVSSAGAAAPVVIEAGAFKIQVTADVDMATLATVLDLVASRSLKGKV
jgi:hypothetical protein